jgi:hypothetical protein
MSAARTANEECPRSSENLKSCGCTYTACPRRGNCCLCVRHHRELNELPGCFFPPEVEKTYDRSFARFAEIYSQTS